MSKQVARVGKYEIVQRIGTGGFGAVYEARDPFLKRPVAVKTCLVSDEAEQARFFREAELVGSLRHRNITTVYDFGIHDGMPYLVEELLSGDDLDLLIRREDPIPLARKVEILIGVAYGLEYAHKAGILHRDIKPSNIRLLEDGTVKIMDFGIASSLVPEGNSGETGVALGTSAYLAPERIQGQPVDRRADIFSFGVLAYELLTCHKPFTGDTTSDVLDRILEAEPQPITLFLPDAPAPLAAVVRRALEKEPSHRYESVAALREDLLAVHRNLLGQSRSPVTAPQPVPITPEVLPNSPSAPSFSIERVPRRTVQTAAVAALAFVAVSGSLILLWPGRQREKEPVAVAAVKTEAPASPAILPADADSMPPGPDERPPEIVPATRAAAESRSNSEPQRRSMIQFSSPAPVEAEDARIALASTGTVVELQQARRYTRAAEEPGLSRETRAYLYLRSALAYHAARDLRQARQSLERAFALSPELEVDAQTYGASFTRLAQKARPEGPRD